MLSPVIPTPRNSAMLMKMPSPENRSISSFSTSPSREMRGIKLFRAISRKLARKSQDDLNFGEDADSRSSSTDSCSSTSAGRCQKTKKSLSSGFRSASPQRMSTSSTDTGSDTQSVKHRHSISIESFRKAFQHLTVTTTRSQSCSSGKESKRKHAKKSSPRKILRSPVTYTYVKGLSGLPTQRVPRNQIRICFNGNCCYSVPYNMEKLHR